PSSWTAPERRRAGFTTAGAPNARTSTGSSGSYSITRKRHPAEMGGEEVRAFLSHLAVAKHVSASTQNHALNALRFLYARVLERPLGAVPEIERANRLVRLPVVLSREEVAELLAEMEGLPQLVCRMLYGAGLRLLECLTLRVKDVDF